MPLIKPLEKEAKELLSVSIDESVSNALDQYCTFLASPKGHVVQEIIRHMTKTDNDFKKWKSAHKVNGNGASK